MPRATMPPTLAGSGPGAAGMNVDVLVVGAGPAGLCFARSLKGSGLKVAVVEKQPLEAIAAPAFDGREIALTHASRKILEGLGLWDRFDPADVSELRDAKVTDGDSAHALRISADDGRSDRLGWLRSEERRVGKECRSRGAPVQFSSRRRHTRCGRDWSSDVCSSDLTVARSR